MSKRTVSGITLTLLLISMLTLAFDIQPVKAEPKTWIVDDSVPSICKIHVSKAKAAMPTVKVTSVYNITEPGMTFQVNITVTDVTNLVRWFVDLEWNASAIELTTGDPQGLKQLDPSTGRWVYFNIYEGPFLEDVRKYEDAVFMVGDIDNVHGEIDFLAGGYVQLGPLGANGSGILATINFTCLEVSETTIEITWSALFNIDIDAIAHERVNGTVTYVASERTRVDIGTGWGWMRIAPREYVCGWAELYKIGDEQIELIITCQGEEHSRTWNIIFHREHKYRETYLCYSREWGFLVVGLHKHRRWQFWYAVGKGVVAFGLPRNIRLRFMPT